MDENTKISKNLTIVVNSCDAYEDLWNPFFTLLKKYWTLPDVRILLNTESKVYCHEGLQIECVHSPAECHYGQRMINVLSKVNTKYVLPLLDDFFLRSPVNVERLSQIIHWMEEDSDISYFNCDCNKAYSDWEVNRYPGYRRLPPGNDYIFSMQAAIWRTDRLLRYWRPNVTPWEWEVVCNVLSCDYVRYKHYCVLDMKYAFLDYGYNYEGMGVFRGKWVREDVVPLFEKEGICVDFSKRGFYDPLNVKPVIADSEGRMAQYKLVLRCLGYRYTFKLFLYEIYCSVLHHMNKPIKWADFFTFLREKSMTRFFASERTE